MALNLTTAQKKLMDFVDQSGDGTLALPQFQRNFVWSRDKIEDLAQDWQDVSYVAETDAEARRRYVTSLVRQRLHQRSFRERVLRAYRKQCAFCRLRHAELLDAAHIVPDREPKGEPRVPNGVSLCKLHHAAFDALFLTIRPDDLRIVVREDILTEEDGPMLLHGLQGLHGQRIQHPRNPELRPDRELLASRWERFRAARAAR